MSQYKGKICQYPKSLFFSITHQPTKTQKRGIMQENKNVKIVEIVNKPPKIKFNHQELLRDYAGYDVILEEMEFAIERFLQLYYQNILTLYGESETLEIDSLEVQAAGAGASKFVFGVFGKQSNGNNALIFAIRMYNYISKMRDEQKIYDCAKQYQVKLETYDKKLIDVLIDELRVYEELDNHANTSIDVKGIWTKFSLTQVKNSQKTEYRHYVDKFDYIEDCELKRLLVNLGINAITVGSFMVGYDGKKILEREEFPLPDKINAIIHINNTLLQSWLLTLRYKDKQQLVGRTIVDLKPAQFVVQAEDIKDEKRMPAVIIDVGPAENTDNIYTYVKDIAYMKEMIPAFATEMLKKLSLSEPDKQTAKQAIYQEIINYLNRCQDNEQIPKNIPPQKFLGIINDFLAYMMAK